MGTLAAIIGRVPEHLRCPGTRTARPATPPLKPALSTSLRSKEKKGSRLVKIGLTALWGGAMPPGSSLLDAGSLLLAHGLGVSQLSTSLVYRG